MKLWSRIGNPSSMWVVLLEVHKLTFFRGRH